MNNKKLIFLSAATVIYLFIACFLFIDELYRYRPLFLGAHPFSKVKLDSMGSLMRLKAYIISAIVGFSFMMIIPRRKLGIISTFGQRTLQVYFWHEPIREIAVTLGLRELICASLLGKCIWFIIPIILTFILSTNFFSWPTRFLKYKNIMKT